jgi:23S rRNA (adenine2503-C2)-methyltransferase
MGEPLLNYVEIVKAIKTISDPDFMGIGQRHISISTAGIADKFFKLAHDLPQINLALSLHNADDKERTRLMPIGKKFNLETLKENLEEYIKLTGREVFIEYTVIDGLNNLPAHIRKLGKWINSFKDHYLLHI